MLGAFTRKDLADATREAVGSTHADGAELVEEILELMPDGLAKGPT